jgi:hypothetical protein
MTQDRSQATYDVIEEDSGTVQRDGWSFAKVEREEGGRG